MSTGKKCLYRPKYHNRSIFNNPCYVHNVPKCFSFHIYVATNDFTTSINVSTNDTRSEGSGDTTLSKFLDLN